MDKKIKDIDKEEKMYFGKKFKEIRLKQKIGLRKMAEHIRRKPSELNHIENGFAPHPDKAMLGSMLVALGIENNDDYKELMKLYQEPFVMQKMPEDGFCPHITKRIQTDEPVSEENIKNTRPATKEECDDIGNWLNEQAKAHNKKADAYNKEHGVC